MNQTLPGSRTSARIAAVQALYEMDLTDAPVAQVLKGFEEKRWPHPGQEDIEDSKKIAKNDMRPIDYQFLKYIVSGVAETKVEIDKRIADALSSKWTIDRLEVLIRATLRAGVYELIYGVDVPVRVTLNEYMSVSHVFFSGSEPALINAVMDNLANELRGHEMSENHSLSS